MRGDEIDAQAEIKGSFVRGSRPPELEYEVTFTKRSANPSWNCDITGRGRATRTGD